MRPKSEVISVRLGKLLASLTTSKTLIASFVSIGIVISTSLVIASHISSNNHQTHSVSTPAGSYTATTPLTDNSDATVQEPPQPSQRWT